MRRAQAEALARCADAEEVRRAMHNTIMDLKGAIRVFVRVRPSPEDAAVRVCGGGALELATRPGRAATCFSFDHVFAPGAQQARRAPHTSSELPGAPARRLMTRARAQAEVFAEVAQLVQSALDGYRVCIFAYGSTGARVECCGVPATRRAGERARALTARARHPAGSGKTHTMIGGAGEERGVVPRALEKLYARAGELQQHHGWAITLKVLCRSPLRPPCAGRLPALLVPGPCAWAPPCSPARLLRRGRAQATCLEIFCDELVDLLGGGPPAGKKHTITHGAAGAEVAHLRAVPLDTAAPAQARALLAGAMERRAVAATACNERSSRSHLVFTIAVAASNARTGQTTTGALGPGSAPSHAALSAAARTGRWSHTCGRARPSQPGGPGWQRAAQQERRDRRQAEGDAGAGASVHMQPEWHAVDRLTERTPAGHQQEPVIPGCALRRSWLHLDWHMLRAALLTGLCTCAGDVIAALGSKAEHVPYRNSKVMSAPCM